MKAPRTELLTSPGGALAVSDLVGFMGGASLPARARVAGRVLEVDGGAVLLGDAFAALWVELGRGAEAAERRPGAPDADLAHEVEGGTHVGVGDLAIVAGVPRGGKLVEARVVERMTPRRPPSGRAARAEPPASETDRLVHRGRGAALVRRAQALSAVREIFEERGFVEVETPCMVPSPGLDLHLDAFVIERDRGADPRARHLITSPEYQMKRLLAGGVPRCFQLARCFRRGEVGGRHNPEFTMLEWYRAFAGVSEVMADTEAVVRGVAAALGGDALRHGDAFAALSAPFERITVGDAFARFAGVPADDAIAMASHDEERFFHLLAFTVEPELARIPRPVFLIDYPAPFASLARLKPDDPRVCERFELYACGVELCNGFGELTDPAEQRTRFERDQAERARAGKPVYPIDERFLDALEEGLPPAAGNALGIDRLVALCLGADRIGDVLAFPLDWL